MAPLEGNLRRASINLEHLPGKSGHHALEGLVGGVEGGAHGTVVLVALDDGVVGTDREHVLARLRRAAVDREGIRRLVDRAPVLQVHLVARLDLPVLD